MGIKDADHEESSPQASSLIIHKLACSLVGQEQEVELQPGSIVSSIYAPVKTPREQFMCNYGLNPSYQPLISAGGLVISGLDSAGEARVVELPGHRFFIGTLFLPQLSSQPGKSHPLVAAFLKAAAAGS